MSGAALALRRRWLALSADLDLGEALIAAYDEPQRRYHGLGHVLWLLEEEERRAALIADRALVLNAIWFHDAVYDPRAPDNEERSADWALRAIPDAALAARVARLILKTKAHGAGQASADEALFLDMDIAILGAPAETYRRYADDIRAEYGHVPDAAFAAGRGAFLNGLAAQTRLFRTDLYEGELAVLARANIAWELARLKASA